MNACLMTIDKMAQETCQFLGVIGIDRLVVDLFVLDRASAQVGQSQVEEEGAVEKRIYRESWNVVACWHRMICQVEILRWQGSWRELRVGEVAHNLLIPEYPWRVIIVISNICARGMLPRVGNTITSLNWRSSGRHTAFRR